MHSYSSMKNFIIRYYSQNGEDYILWKLFDFKKTGFFIDVGAFDGMHLSNTLSFEHQGWNGICVEANKKYFKFCNERRKNSICLNFACIDNPQQKTVQFYSEELGLLSSTIHSKAHEKDIKNRYNKRGLKFEGIKKTRVNATTINNILKEYKSEISNGIDFISIDVEGNELLVLRGFDIQKYSPRVILIEANNDEAYRELNNYIVNVNGYFFARRLNENLFFTRDIEDAKKISDIIINCVIEKQAHPLGEKYTPLQFIKGHIIDTEKENLKTQLNKLQTSLKEKEQQVTNLSKDAEAYKKQIREKEQQVTILSKDAEAYKKQIREKEQQVTNLSKDAETYKKQIKEKEQQIKNLSKEAESYKEQITKKERQINSLSKDGEFNKKQIGDKDSLVNKLIDNISNISNEKENISNQLTTFKVTLNNKFNEVFSRIKAKDKEFESYRMHIETLKKEKQDIHDKLTEIEDKFIAIQKECLAKENQISAIEKNLLKMEEQLKTSYQTLEYRQKELDTIYNSRTWKLMSFRNRIGFKIKH